MVEDRRPKERLSFEAGVWMLSLWSGVWGLGALAHSLPTSPQVLVLAELFLEMLQRDFGYRIYKMLLSLPEKAVSPPEPEKEEAAKEEVVKEEEAVKEAVVKEPKEEEAQSEGAAAAADASLVSTCWAPGTPGHGACLCQALLAALACPVAFPAPGTPWWWPPARASDHAVGRAKAQISLQLRCLQD